MPRQYTKVELLSEEVKLLKAAGKTNREIGENFGLVSLRIQVELLRNFLSEAGRR